MVIKSIIARAGDPYTLEVLDQNPNYEIEGDKLIGTYFIKDEDYKQIEVDSSWQVSMECLFDGKEGSDDKS